VSFKNWPTTLRLAGVLPSAEGYESIMSILPKKFDPIRDPIKSPFWNQKIWLVSSQIRLPYHTEIFLRPL
jgi:hypothetical protein